MPLGAENLFGLHQYDNRTGFFTESHIFSPGIGYAVVCGFGVLFAALTLFAMYLDKKYAGSAYNSEEFNTAGRAIKTGLTAVDVVSRSTWVASIVQSSNLAWQFGIAGAYWYGVGAAAQFCLLGALSLQLKRRAPKAHTVVELVRRRWGNVASFVFLYICLLNNLCVTTLLIIGAANLLSAATGMNIFAGMIFIPLSIIIYAISGGLKATFFSSYLHTIVICIALNVFCFKVYSSGVHPVGSITKVWENLTTYAKLVPAPPGNKDGSYLTMRSELSAQFGIYTFFAAAGILFSDQSYWQGVIAATPKAAFKGYVLGALLWIPIPFAMATAFGLVTRAADLPISLAEANGGLVPLAAAQFVLGSAGVILLLTMVFMAVTSVGSAEFLSMSSLFTYDVYKAYLNPEATGEQMLMVSRFGVAFFGLAAGALSCLLHQASVDVAFLFLVMGILVCSSAFPVIFMITWPQVPAGAAITAALGGQMAGVATWLAYAQIKFGELTIRFSLQQLGPSLSGSTVSLFSSALICIAWTLLAPGDRESFKRFQDIELMDNVKVPEMNAGSGEYDRAELQRLYNKTSVVAVGIVIVLMVFWPVLSLPAGVFNKEYFTFWVVLALSWAMITTLVCTFLPLIESRELLLHIVKQILGLQAKSVLPVASSPLKGKEDDYGLPSRSPRSPDFFTEAKL